MFDLSKEIMRLRKAREDEFETVWNIIADAKERRRLDGSNQWQDGYPKPESVQYDYEKGYAYVVADDADNILTYASVMFDEEPAYTAIEGKWLTHQDYMVIHRVASSTEALGKGTVQFLFLELEKVAVENGVFSIRVDTNFDNGPMLHIIDKLGYIYCGEVYFRGSARRAFEKVLK